MTYVQINRGCKNRGSLGRVMYVTPSGLFRIEFPNGKKIYLESSESFTEYASVSQKKAEQMFKYAQRKQ
jgi:hypothetical protein